MSSSHDSLALVNGCLVLTKQITRPTSYVLEGKKWCVMIDSMVALLREETNLTLVAYLTGEEGEPEIPITIFQVRGGKGDWVQCLNSTGKGHFVGPLQVNNEMKIILKQAVAEGEVLTIHPRNEVLNFTELVAIVHVL